MTYIKKVFQIEKSTSTSQKNISEIIKMIKDGGYLLPDFQRDYVWNLEKCRRLLLSIITNSVVGGILIWKTTHKIKLINMIEGKTFNYKDENHYILDGQQRMTSLFYALNGGIYKNIDFSTLKINLEAENLDELILISKEDKPHLITFSDLNNFNDIVTKVDSSLIGPLALMQQKILNYAITVFEFKTDSLEEAIYQFNALNSGGKNMTKEEILLSKIYSNTFKLKEEMTTLAETLKEFKLKDTLILSCLSTCLKNAYGAKDMISMELDEVQFNWNRFVQSIKITCDYLKSIGITAIDSLPYMNCFIVINKVLFDNKIVSLNTIEDSILKRYILFSGLTSRYAIGSTPKTHGDISQLNKMFLNQMPDFPKVNIKEEDIIKYGESFSKNNGNSYRKVVLWILSQNSPISLLNNNKVSVDGRSFSKKYCKNLHHIFPKAFMKDTNSNYEVDHLVNICIIEADVNQRMISDKAPSVYLQEMALLNNNIKEACKTHLIDYDIAVTNNYDSFFEDRVRKIKILLESYF